MEFIPFLIFVVLMVGTPGPANMLLLTSGGNFGFWASLPFVAGVTCGKLLLNCLLGIGLWEFLSADNRVLFGLKIICVGYLAWLALKMSGFLFSRKQLKKPETFWSGLVVHPLNPKAWAMLVFAYAHFTNPEQDLLGQAVLLSGTFFIVQVFFHSLWCAGGALVLSAVAGKPTERWLMRGLSIVTVLIVIWAVLLDTNLGN